MKRRIISILLALCLALTLLPAAAFAAEEGVDNAPAAAGASGGEAAGTGATAEEPQQEQQKAQPEEPEQPQQPEEQPEANPESQLEAEGENTPVLLNGKGETTQEVSNASDLTAAIKDYTVTTVKLATDIDISSPLTVTRTVTLDLNGKVLRMTGNDTVIDVKKDDRFGIGYLTLTDSDSAAVHKFTPNEDGLWVLDETNGTKTVNGGVITGGKDMGIFVEGYGTQQPTQKPDEAACAHLIMRGGNIVGCMTERTGGGVCAVRHAYFTMTGGSIRGCVAKVSGGGVSLSSAAFFAMDGSALIADCVSTGSTNSAGGGIDAYGSSATLSGNAAIRNCTAELGGGVYLDSTYLTMSGNASIIGCTATNGGGGVHTRGDTGDLEGNTVIFTMKDASSIVNCTALKGGGVFFMTSHGVMSLSGNAKIENCRAIEREGLSIPDVIGGGVLVVIGRLEISGGSITGCTAAKGGDSVFTELSGGFTMTGGSVDGSIRLSYSVGNNTVYMDGLGTKESPYEIGTADQLKLFRQIVNGAQTNNQNAVLPPQNTAAWAKLTGNIDLGNEEWTPIGNEPNYNGPGAYSGTFDGDGHTVSGLKVSSAEKYIGLFGQISGATVKNLTVSGKVTGSVVRGGSYAGGIAGYALVSRIEGCRNSCQVTGTGIPGQGLVYVGGIVGNAMGSAMVSTITDCVNTGAIEMIGGGTSFIGGIAGCLNGTAVSGCSNTGAVSSHGDSQEFEGKAGGITGMTDGTVSGCYNTGSVTILYTGEENSSSAPAAGGIVGWANGEVRDCYNVGAVSATGARTYAGGIAGYRGNGGEVWKAYNVGRVTNTGGVIAAGIAGGNAIGSGVGNIYYLAGSAENGMGVGANGDPNTDDLSLPLSDFANGKVLEEMIGGRGSDETGNPWADTCRYLAAAGKTLPVFKGQGDPHDHAFSKATCTSLAACSCGVTTGALDPSNHPNLKHKPAKAATTFAEGNIEYWYCPDCGKYYKDAKTTQEIGQKDTVTSRLTSGTGGGFPFSGKKDDGKKDDAKTVKSGQTGDPGVALYGAMALLSLTGGTWLVGKKRK